MNKEQKYPSCWMCDNIVDHPEQIGLLYLNFPRCFVIVPSSGDFYGQTFEEFLKTAKVNWLDPKDKGTPNEQKQVLMTLWNFSVEQDEEEDRLAEENGY